MDNTRRMHMSAGIELKAAADTRFAFCLNAVHSRRLGPYHVGTVHGWVQS